MGKIYSAAPSKKRVAAYARVSLETDKLEHSLSQQVAFYTEFIANRPDWVLAGVYADSFITGTLKEPRAEFLRLLGDCDSGKVDVILCKSISRFARNTVDLLETVRHLRDLGIEIRFEKENINSLSEDGELLLTILASFAQEESRSISENVKWGIRKRFREGNSTPRNKKVFGYQYRGAEYVVVSEEAAAVRQIFEDYINGVSLRKISEHLKARGIKTTGGFDFSHSEIDYIVRNEIYIGDIVQQKTFVKDHIAHRKAKNRGELPQYRKIAVHEPIISADIFEQAQRETLRRAAKKSVYCFSGKLICGGCGKPFTRRSNNGKYACWHCRNCLGIKLKEDKLKEFFGLSEEEISNELLKATINENGKLDVEFYNGRHEQWKYN